MTLPADVTLVTVTGTYLTEEGAPADGALIFTPSVATIRDPADDTMLKTRQQRVELDVTGSFAIDLIATNDPDLIPVGWHYDVTERIGGYPQRTWIIQIPYTLTTLDIADVPTSVDPSTPTYPAPVFAVTSVVGQIGDVTGAEILADTTIAAALEAKADDADLDALTTVVAGKADTAALAAYVPYTGATGDVDLNGHQIFGHNLGHFEGALIDPTITDNGDGTIDVSSIECMIRVHPTDPDAHRVRVDVPAATSLSITDNDTNFLVVDYGAGSPHYEVTLDAFDVSLSRVPVARVYREGTAVLCQLVYGAAGRSTPGRHLYREALLSEPTGARRESGVGITESPTRVVTVGAGVVWFVLARTTLDQITMGDVDVEANLIYHVAGVWTKTPVTQYDNTYYDDGTDLVPLGNNKYGVCWIYRGIGAKRIGVVLGRGNYTLAEAIASGVPPVPEWVTQFCWLAGRIIVEKGASSATLIENNTAGTEFAGAAVSIHNNLDGLQGGTPGEYYHLTAAEYATIGAGYVPYTGATTDLDLGTHQVFAGNVNLTEGVLSDPTILDATGAAINIASCDVVMRSGPGWPSPLYRRTVPANTALSVTDDAVNYIYVAWNGGSPVYAATTDRTIIDYSSIVPVARVAMDGGSIEHQMAYGSVARGAAVRNLYRILNIRGTGGIERESGFGLSESPTRVVTIGAGYAWFGLRRLALGAITNGVAGATMKLYYHTAGVWNESTITAYNNTQYDNGTNLATLTPGRYAVNWIYRNLVADEIDVVLGTGNYTLAQAEASQVPAIPPVMSAFYVLTGRIIVQASASTATVIQNVVNTAFAQAAVSDHEDLSGLQGGTTGEHYHLTATQHGTYGTATAIAAGTPASSGAAGTAGQILYDTNYIYVCVATNTWRRTPLSAF